MKEIKVIAYEAFDGEVFLDKSQCEIHESEMRLKMRKDEIKEKYDKVIDEVNCLCDLMADICEGDCNNYCASSECPFHSIEKDSGCKLDFPEYK